jgi:hypothetical protein
MVSRWVEDLRSEICEGNRGIWMINGRARDEKSGIEDVLVFF